MVREIKFRAWDEQNNEWMYAGLKNEIRSFPLTVSNPLSLCLDDRFGDKYENTVWCLNNDELIWCQYTGLKDKNGVEIYEGDILKISNISVLRCEFKNGCFVLIHSKEFAGVDNLLWGNLGRLYDTNMNDIFELTEVIGNIYENKELLEGF